MSPIPTSLSTNPKPKPYKAKPKSKQTAQDREFLSGAPARALNPVPILSPAQAAQIVGNGNASVSVDNEKPLPLTGTIVGFIPDEPAPVEDIITQAWKMAGLPYPFPEEIEILDEPKFPKPTFTIKTTKKRRNGKLKEIPRPPPNTPHKFVMNPETGIIHRLHTPRQNKTSRK